MKINAELDSCASDDPCEPETWWINLDCPVCKLRRASSDDDLRELKCYDCGTVFATDSKNPFDKESEWRIIPVDTKPDCA
jgi:hypothetical protein